MGDTETQAQIFMLSNEVGTGIVPLGQLSREFVNKAGWVIQVVTDMCERVD